MGAGGGIWDSARAELLRPGLSIAGAGISIVFSAGRGTGVGGGAITGATVFLAAIAFFGASWSAFAGTAADLIGDLMVFVGVAFAVGFFGAGLVLAVGEGRAAFETAAAGLSAAFTATFEAGFVGATPFEDDLPTGLVTGFTALGAVLAATPATGLALAAVFATAFTVDFSITFTAAFSTAFTAGLALALALLTAVAVVFLAGAFTVCLLGEAASG